MPPSIQILPPNGQTTARKGGTVTFECRANGNPPPVVQWSKKDGLLPSGNQIQTGYVLTINDIQRQHAGIYHCTAANGIGQPVVGDIGLHVLCKLLQHANFQHNVFVTTRVFQIRRKSMCCARG